MTSSAVKFLPSCQVMPGRRRMIQFESDPCGVIDSASTYSTRACASSWASGWYSDCSRDVSRYVRLLCGSRVSELEPPVRPSLRLPPRRKERLAWVAFLTVPELELPLLHAL